MVDVTYVRGMARYNRWQNESLYGVADTLSDEERRRERGAFFGSIHGTLSHLLWADQIWMSRFAGTPRPAGGIPESAALFPDWDALKRERVAFDQTIIDWADGLDPAWLEGDLAWYSGAAKRDMTTAKWIVTVHFFNHQTHHRGQVHCMLTQAGTKPGVTDFPALPMV
jgi:uncharacterized damage-inducible protein DinB